MLGKTHNSYQTSFVVSIKTILETGRVDDLENSREEASLELSVSVCLLFEFGKGIKITFDWNCLLLYACCLSLETFSAGYFDTNLMNISR
jgi:hypothetical protein